MLVLSRKPGESIYIGDDIVIKVLNIRYRQLQLGITAPPSLPIVRDDAKKKSLDLAGHPENARKTGCLQENEL